MTDQREKAHQSRKKIKRLSYIIIVGAIIFITLLAFLLETL
jgi:hypothetical protein